MQLEYIFLKLNRAMNFKNDTKKTEKARRTRTSLNKKPLPSYDFENVIHMER
jgi:hypothetical protein